MKIDGRTGLLLALVFIAGFALGATVNLPSLPQTASPEPGTISLMLDYGDGSVETYDNVSVSANESLFQAMEKTAKENNLTFESKGYEGLGTLITKIGEKENGADNRYWQYWVNHKKPEVGASAYVLQPGDFVEWKFIPFKGE